MKQADSEPDVNQCFNGMDEFIWSLISSFQNPNDSFFYVIDNEEPFEKILQCGVEDLANKLNSVNVFLIVEMVSFRLLISGIIEFVLFQKIELFEWDFCKYEGSYFGIKFLDCY